MLDLELLEAYGLGDIFGAAASPEAPANVTRIVEAAKAVLAKLKAPRPATETVKADSKFVAAAKADEKAKATAEAFLHAVAVDVLEKFADAPNVLYWLRNTDTLSNVLKSEVEYHTYAADKSAPVEVSIEDEKAALAKDYRGLKVQADLFFGMVPLPDKVQWKPNTVRVSSKSGHLETDLDSLQGNYGASDGTVATGKYAKAWAVTYLVDGDEIVGDAREAIRAIWIGTNRVGISTGDLFRLIDGDPWVKINKGETVKFKAEGGRKAFQVYRTTKDLD